MTRPFPTDLAGWTPIRLTPGGDEPVVDWCYTEGESFDDPFFDQTVERCLRHPFRLLFRHSTPISALGEVAAAGDALPLAGLVFHTSRCGSTLVTQMLNRLPSVLVMAEPSPLHSVLEAGSSYPGLAPDTHRDWIRWIVAALGQRRQPEQRQLVIKMDAWAVFWLPLIAQACPGVPWVFVYRDPLDVVLSQLGVRGYHMIPGSLPASRLGLAEDEPTQLPPEVYVARVLAALLEAAAAGVGGSAGGGWGVARLVNYDELPGAVVSRIAPWFGLEFGPDEREAMIQAAGRDAKNPSLPYDRRTRPHVADELRAAVDRWAGPGYRLLEAQRAAQAP